MLAIVGCVALLLAGIVAHFLAQKWPNSWTYLDAMIAANCICFALFATHYLSLFRVTVISDATLVVLASTLLLGFTHAVQGAWFVDLFYPIICFAGMIGFGFGFLHAKRRRGKHWLTGQPCSVSHISITLRELLVWIAIASIHIKIATGGFWYYVADYPGLYITLWCVVAVVSYVCVWVVLIPLEAWITEARLRWLTRLSMIAIPIATTLLVMQVLDYQRSNAAGHFWYIGSISMFSSTLLILWTFAVRTAFGEQKINHDTSILSPSVK